MGRLQKPRQQITSSTGVTIDEKLNVHVFIDEYGNVTQINKINKDRLKYCIDPDVPQSEIVSSCVIGISDPIEGDCTRGIGLGVGDNKYTYAKYE